MYIFIQSNFFFFQYVVQKPFPILVGPCIFAGSLYPLGEEDSINVRMEYSINGPQENYVSFTCSLSVWLQLADLVVSVRNNWVFCFISLFHDLSYVTVCMIYLSCGWDWYLNLLSDCAFAKLVANQKTKSLWRETMLGRTIWINILLFWFESAVGKSKQWQYMYIYGWN